MTDAANTPERLTELEARVSALEARLPAANDRAGATDPSGSASPDDTFWALEGLRARAPESGAVLFTGTVTFPDGARAEWQQGSATEDLLAADWNSTAETLGALGHPVRLRLLREILLGTTTAAGLTSIDGMGTSGQVYHHLRQLSAAGWIRALGGGRHEVPAARVVPLLTIVAGAQR